MREYSKTMNEFSGEITADFVDVKFAFSGKVADLKKAVGQKVKKGEILALLDTQLLEVEHAKELAQYEKTRAEFEIFRLKHGNGPDAEDTIKFLRTKQQADLDSSVKNIESSKLRLDQSILLSPVTGTVIDMHGLVKGLYTTPASNPITIMDQESLTFVIEVPQTEIFQFREERQMRVYIEGISDEIIGIQRLPTHGKKGSFLIPIALSYNEFLFPGMQGKATFKLD